VRKKTRLTDRVTDRIDPVHSRSTTRDDLVRRFRFVIGALCCAGSCLVVTGCRCTCGDEPELLARVVQIDPVTEISSSGSAWQPASPDDGLNEGDALRTGDAGRATLEVIGQGAVKVGPRSLVRFGDPGEAGGRGGNELRLVLETGELMAEASTTEAPALVLTGPSGEAVRLERGSKVRLVFDEAERLRLEVEAGTTNIEHQGQTTKVAAGQTFSFGVAERVPTTKVAGVPDAGRVAPVEAGDAGPADAAADGDAGEPAKGIQIRNLGGAVVEVREPGAEEYTPLKRTRSTVEPGSSVRVSGSDGVEVSCCGGTAVVLQPGSNAVVGGARGNRLLVRLSGGRAEATGGAGGVASLDVPGGHVESAEVGVAGTFVAAVRDARSTRVIVRSGAAVVVSGGRRELLYTGAEVVVDSRELTITRATEVRPTFTGSATFFDPQPRGTFTIRFDPIAGCSTYMIRVDRGGRRNIEALTDRAMIVVHDGDYGEYRYRAACMIDGAPRWTEAIEGRVSRQPDRSSHAELPTKAPSSALDSDGRTYTVTYQNLLPAITLRWTRAPEASSYSLEVVEDGTGQRMHRSTSTRPVMSFRSGFFREGRYYWYFRTEGTDPRVTSPVSFAQVTFDNVAPTIHIIEPAEGAPATGTVRLRGVAAVGSTVHANGVALELGRDFRFDQQVPVGPDNLLIIRVATPGRGSGYYLRHLNR
jgi:hypothetical protein